jgi:hypothetical protein
LLLAWNASVGITEQKIALPDGIILHSKAKVVLAGSLLDKNVRMGKAVKNVLLLIIGMASV